MYTNNIKFLVLYYFMLNKTQKGDGKMKKIFASIMVIAVLSVSFVGISGVVNEQQVEAGGVTTKGVSVATVQKQLNTWLTYNPLFRDYGFLTVDGVFGNKTNLNVIQYQRTHRLVADGFVGPATWASLKNEYTYYTYATQRACNSELGVNITVDGVYGNATKNAVRAVQRKHGLYQDGIAGAATWEILKHWVN
ncbi:peptidoglycan-binding domain-containing protein [Listeria booriae]|uniref:peptidoglycan-binding domain-containing protein n=1 Tax=Listeria booriae TaxID=1552123 RepID=UPI00164DBF56|nr:peptidoglycan-binding protein [Listeria booriae]MBC6300942.1 peptidoglycan-binding protein [Listeria booriae]